jgi:eukaryotic-like serine/threonine-protein kinase
MAEIFLALQTGAEGFQKPVVLKRILPAFAADPHFVRMLVDEAHIASSLSHSHLVQVLDLGKAGGQFFLVLEFVDGWSLEQVRRRAQKARLKVPLPLTLYVVSTLCRALSYVHRRTRDGRSLGIVHRDVSPQNVLLGREGEVKLADFGIAKAVGRREKSATGIIKGKFAYMSPEQSIGSALDARSDLFSVGTLLYILTTGRKPFDAPTDLEVLMQVRRARFEKPSAFLKEFNPEVERFIARALRADRARRWQSAEQMADRLDAILVKIGQPNGPAALKRWLDALSARDGIKFPGDLADVETEAGVGTIELETGDLEVPDTGSGEIGSAPAPRRARTREASASAASSSPSSVSSYLSLSIATAEMSARALSPLLGEPSPRTVLAPPQLAEAARAQPETTVRRAPLFMLGEPVLSAPETTDPELPIVADDDTPAPAEITARKSITPIGALSSATARYPVVFPPRPPTAELTPSPSPSPPTAPLAKTVVTPSALAPRPSFVAPPAIAAGPARAIPDVRSNPPAAPRSRWRRRALTAAASLAILAGGGYAARAQLSPSLPPWAVARLTRPVDAWLRRLPARLHLGQSQGLDQQR